MDKTIRIDILELIAKENPLGVIGSPSSSFEAIVDIRDVSEESKLLGELVCFTVKEGDKNVLILGANYRDRNKKQMA